MFFGSSGRLSLTCSEHEDVISCDVCGDNCEVVDPTHPIDLPSVRVSDVGYRLWKKCVAHKCEAQCWPARCEKMPDCLAIQVRAVLKCHQLQQQVTWNNLVEES